MIYFILSTGLLFFISTLYIFKYIKLRKRIRQMYTYNRIGIINHSNWAGRAQIHVEELERFKNGMSRIKIIKIDVFEGVDAKSNIKKYFREIQDTSNVIWLERDEDLLEVRRKKLKRLL